MPDRLTPEGGHGFIVSWARLVVLLVVVAALSSIFTTVVLSSLVSSKVSSADLTDAFRKGCDRNVGAAHDSADISDAERRYKRAVLAASSVKGDVKLAVSRALDVYDRVYPRQRSRIINCALAFPSHGKPQIVRVK